MLTVRASLASASDSSPHVRAETIADFFPSSPAQVHPRVCRENYCRIKTQPCTNRLSTPALRIAVCLPHPYPASHSASTPSFLRMCLFSTSENSNLYDYSPQTPASSLTHSAPRASPPIVITTPCAIGSCHFCTLPPPFTQGVAQKRRLKSCKTSIICRDAFRARLRTSSAAPERISSLSTIFRSCLICIFFCFACRKRKIKRSLPGCRAKTKTGNLARHPYLSRCISRMSPHLVYRTRAHKQPLDNLQVLSGLRLVLLCLQEAQDKAKSVRVSRKNGRLEILQDILICRDAFRARLRTSSAAPERISSLLTIFRSCLVCVLLCFGLHGSARQSQVRQGVAQKRGREILQGIYCLSRCIACASSHLLYRTRAHKKLLGNLQVVCLLYALLYRATPKNFPFFVGPPEGKQHRKSHMTVLEITSAFLVQQMRSEVVEQVVTHLKGHAQKKTIPLQTPHARLKTSQQSSYLTRSRKKRSRLRLNHLPT